MSTQAIRTNEVRPLLVLAVMEAKSVSGPAKNLLATAVRCGREEASRARIHVVTFTRDGAPRGFIEACERADVPVDVVRERFPFDWGVIPQLRAIIRRRQPDVLQSHITKSHLLVRLCGLNRGRPWIAFNHGYTAEDFKVRLYNQFDRWSLRGADRVVTVCGAFTKRLRRWGVRQDRITVRHNSVVPPRTAELVAVAELRSRLALPDGACVVLAVGRLSAEKGHADLIRAAAELAKGHGVPEFRLVIVGEGPDRQKLERLCSRLGASELVLLPGATTDVWRYYAVADLFVLPSHSEGSPNVLLEAMAAGLPIVSTDAGGAAELVENEKTALVVPCRDAKALKVAMEQLLSNRKLGRQLGDAARVASERHSPDAYTAALVELYETLVAERSVGKP